MEKFKMEIYLNEKGETYYKIKKVDSAILTIEEQVLAGIVYTLFDEGIEGMMQFLKKEGLIENE